MIKKFFLSLIIIITSCKRQTNAVSINCLEKEKTNIHSISILTDEKENKTINFYKDKCIKYECKQYVINNNSIKEVSKTIRNNYCLNGDLFF